MSKVIIKCKYCGVKVRGDRYGKHKNKIHPREAFIESPAIVLCHLCGAHVRSDRYARHIEKVHLGDGEFLKVSVYIPKEKIEQRDLNYLEAVLGSEGITYKVENPSDGPTPELSDKKI